ncbi:1-acyl-sn-glycerol-3-phosphate acyltransferase [Nocardioides dokdonensis FR1436]|uniref:1-acyl-sn-glycerol-3-phosphate acyltransferase n=1 Tax=Nocardioides dokdonensis FR1436 TaxID=1300347 RepID=A0A1A9GPH0_9ACTN|nr:lysophospholipid acyltransferase family protein [Nocardioides dokdonensis]ANH39503.1 1-acyl-sn-glycerol-3-phosphate acyltransferase [Nocardioides dokdonensis FR1436]
MSGTHLPQVRSGHADLPRTEHVAHPHRLMLRSLRPVSRWLLRRRYRVQVLGAANVPARGPVVFAANHAGVIDGPMLAIYAPRPVHALTKVEMFSGRLGTLLRWAGQVPLDRFRTDVAAARSCVRVLRDDGAIGIFPEGHRGGGDLQRFHRGAAYFSLVAGATVVPVSFLGTREPGGSSSSLPRRGARLHVVFGQPIGIDAAPFPRSKEQVEATSLLLWQHMVRELDAAKARTGCELPGPLPAGELEPDPATGVTDLGAP